MPFCPTCGAAVEGRFCASCGSAVPAGTPSGAGTTPPPSTRYAGSVAMTDNVAGALCYSLGFVTGILFLVLAPYNQNKTIRFHAFQSIFLNVAAFVVSFALSIIFGVAQF